MIDASLRRRLGALAGGLLLGITVGWLLGRDGDGDVSPEELDTAELVAELETEHAAVGALIAELSDRLEGAASDNLDFDFTVDYETSEMAEMTEEIADSMAAAEDLESEEVELDEEDDEGVDLEDVDLDEDIGI